MEELKQCLQRILEDDIAKMILSNPRDNSVLYHKISIQKKQSFYQVEQYTQKQVFHENLQKEELKETLLERMETDFMQLDAWSGQQEYHVKISKKGKLLFHKQNKKSELPKIMQHNRKKEYLLEEGQMIPPLVDMGIFTKDGMVVQSMYDKYKQINRFVEIVEDALKYLGEKKVHIIDFGCGKSYLTFVLYYYLKEIKGMDIYMVGLDLKEEVIHKCNETAQKYKYDNLTFQVGNIEGYQTTTPVDMVISLHACDTATDYAIFHAVRWNAKVIISVPCCQHELSKQMQKDTLPILSRYGIVKERTAALMTDAIRANLLTACGYKTQLLEFVDLSHTPKNLLIRAVHTSLPKKNRNEALREVQEITEAFHLTPTLLTLFQEQKKELFE